MSGILPLLIGLSAGVPASTIFGDVRLGEKYVADADITLACGADSATGKTDAEGSFRLTVKTGGKCQITVSYEKQAPSVEVVAFDKPARYRLVLELKDGKYLLKRV